MKLLELVKAMLIFNKCNPDSEGWVFEGDDTEGYCQFDTTDLSEKDRKTLTEFGFKSKDNLNSEYEWFAY